MLILAGVSLNAIVGDNGIITNAQNANMKSGMAALEEYLQEKYLEFYEDQEKYVSKIDLLSAKMPNLLFKNGSKNYFLYDKKVYYVINKASLPEEVRKGLIGGNSSETIAVKNLYDVYGVNPDLTVYYIDKSTGTTYGNINASALDKNMKAQQVISGDSGVRSIVEEALDSLGIAVDPDLDITMGNVTSIQQLTIDGGQHAITSLNGIADLISLRKLTLKNLNLTDLNGLENCILLEWLYLDNCTISNSVSGYNSLTSLVKLKTLYMCLPKDMDVETANAQVVGLSNGLHNATYTSGLTTFAVFGARKFGSYVMADLFDADLYPWNYKYDPTIQSNANFPEYVGRSADYLLSGNLSNISSLSNIASNIKNSILKMYLNGNNLGSVSCLASFSNITDLWLHKNDNLVSLTGLENHKDLTRLVASNCSFTDLTGLIGCTSLDYLLINNNKFLTSLAGLENINLTTIYAMNCSGLTDISALASKNDKGELIHTNFINAFFIDDSNLENVSYLGKLNSIRYLFLKGCKAEDNEISKEYWLAIDDVVALCGTKCSLPDICNNWLSNSNVVDYAIEDPAESLIDYSAKMERLRGKTKVTRLSLKNNAALSDNYLNEVLSTMTGMEYLQLYGCVNLETIEFAVHMPNLKELDLRGTSITDFTTYDNYVASPSRPSLYLQTLIIDKTDTDMKTMQNIINKIQHGSNDYSSWVHASYIVCRGILLIGSGYDFTGCTSITRFDSANYLGNETDTIDLSPCTNLKSFLKYGCKQSYILPSGVISYYNRTNTGVDDLSRVIGPLIVATDEGTESLGDTLKTMPATSRIASISHTRFGYEDFMYLKKINSTVAENIKSFTQYRNINSYFTSLSGLEVLTGLTTLRLEWGNLTDLSTLSELYSLKDLTISNTLVGDWSTLPTSFNYTVYNEETAETENKVNYLTTLKVEKSNLNSFSFLKSDNQLETLTLTSNAIGSITGLSYCKALKNLNLENNSIANLAGMQGILVVDEGKTTDPSNPVYKTTLTYLNLSGNPIGNESIFESDNVEMIDLLKKSGVTSLVTTGIVFSS